MPDYSYVRAHLIEDVITEGDARALLAEAKDVPGSDLSGDLVTGFHFWGHVEPDGVKLVRCDVTPIEKVNDQQD